MCCVRTSGDWFLAFFGNDPVAAVQGCDNGGVTGRERRMSCVCSSSGAGSCISLLFLLLSGSAAHLSLSLQPPCIRFSSEGSYQKSSALIISSFGQCFRHPGALSLRGRTKLSSLRRLFPTLTLWLAYTIPCATGEGSCQITIKQYLYCTGDGVRSP